MLFSLSGRITFAIWVLFHCCLKCSIKNKDLLLDHVYLVFNCTRVTNTLVRCFGGCQNTETGSLCSKAYLIYTSCFLGKMMLWWFRFGTEQSKACKEDLLGEESGWWGVCKIRGNLAHFSPCQVPCVRWLMHIPQIKACSAPVVIVKFFIGVTCWSFCCWGGWKKDDMVVASLFEAEFYQTTEVLNVLQVLHPQ